MEAVMAHTFMIELFANMHFCMYGALAGIFFVRAFFAWKERNHHEAHQHGIEGLIHAILAILHL
jgi:hypothetical protein